MFHRTGLVRLAIVGVLVAVVAGSTAWWVQQRPQQIANAQPQLHVDPAALDFGEVWETDRFRWELPITNRGTDPIEVEQIQAGCNCLKVEPAQFSVAPGERKKVTLILNLRGDISNTEAAPVRKFHLPLMVLTPKVKNKPEIWILKGDIRTAVAVSAREVDGGEVVRGQRPATQKIHILGRVPLQSLEVACDPSTATVALHRSAEPNQWHLEIQPSPKTTIGNFIEPLVLTAQTTNGERLPPLELPFKVKVTEDIGVFPSDHVLLGTHRVGSEAEATIVLKSRTCNSFTAHLPEKDSGVRVQWLGKQAGEMHNRITLKIDRQGDGSTQVRFPVSTSRNESLTLPVKVTYYGLK